MLSESDHEAIQIDRRNDGVVLATAEPARQVERCERADAYATFEVAREFADGPAGGVLVVTGAGRALCADGDVSGGSRAAESKLMREATRIVEHLLNCRKPVVSAVNGYAMGLGATVALLGYAVVPGAPPCSPILTCRYSREGGRRGGAGGQLIWPHSWLDRVDKLQLAAG
jgi:enoyl-CoA hydratase/carnithine racemase